MHPYVSVLLISVGVVVATVIVLLASVFAWSRDVTTLVRPGTRYCVMGQEHVVSPDMEIHGPTIKVAEWVHNDLVRMMEVLDRALTKHGVDYWITAGTLLGYERNGGIIPWDDDIDIAINLCDIGNVCQAIDEIEKLDEFRFLELGAGFLGMTNKRYAFPFIDIVFYHYDREAKRLRQCPPMNPDGSSTWGIAKMWPRENFVHNEIFPLRRGQFENITVNVPRNSKQLVERFYGKDAMTVGKLSNMTWIIHATSIMATLFTVKRPSSCRRVEEYEATNECPAPMNQKRIQGIPPSR